MALKKLLFSLTLLLLAISTIAQTSETVLSGKVVDQDDNTPIPFANVVFVPSSDQSASRGTTTDIDGNFTLITSRESGQLEISFIGYEKEVIKDLNPERKNLNLDLIKIKKSTETLNEIDLTAEKSSVEFKLDKRVFNVGKDLSSTGVGALEVLNSVPSVNVDIEGGVTLRGNAGVQILINGKPSVLADEQSNALGTISADMIESIEVITNPSAKYEAEGSSGIINIILKKEEKKGFNGSVSLNTGAPNNHSLGGSMNYRTDNFNFFTQFGAGYRTRPRYSNSENINLVTNASVLSNGVAKRNENFYNITLGSDYYINQWNTITLSGRYAYEFESNPSQTDFSLYDTTGSLYSQYQRTETTQATNPKWQYDLQYKKQFESHEDHVLTFSTQGSFFGKDQSSDFINNYSFGPVTDANQQTATDFYQADYSFKIDYTNPISEYITLETGALYEINDVGNDYEVYNFSNNQWVIDSSLTNNFEYDQNVLGVYGTASYEGTKWGIKVGLRAENTQLNTLLTNTDQSNSQNYTNFFPSLHTSYKVNEFLSIQAGYSQRIFRPRLWHLNPFFNIQNNYNVRTGNPNLQPEFSDSYELTAIYLMEKGSLNASVYHLYTSNVMERVTFFQNNVNVSTPINIGTNNKTGFEVNGKYTPADWFTLTGDFNYGIFVRNGNYENQNFDFTGDQWSTKITTKFKFPYDIDFEMTPNYNSSYKTVQGEISGFASLDLGLRKKLWKGKAVFNLGVRDVFASRIREQIVDQPTFYTYSYSKRGSFVTLGFSYSFGKGEAMSYSGGRR